MECKMTFTLYLYVISISQSSCVHPTWSNVPMAYSKQATSIFQNLITFICKNCLKRASDP